jgi:hypothetical protein
MFGLCAYGYAYNSGAGASLNNSTGLYDEQPIPFDILGVNKNIGIVADVFYIQRSGDYEINYQLDGIVTQTGIVGLVIYVNGFRVPQSVVSKHFVAGQKNIVSGNYSLKLFPNNTVSISVILENGAIFNVESGTYLSVKKLDSCPVRMHRAGVREADAAAEPASDTPQAAEE